MMRVTNFSVVSFRITLAIGRWLRGGGLLGSNLSLSMVCLWFSLALVGPRTELVFVGLPWTKFISLLALVASLLGGCCFLGCNLSLRVMGFWVSLVCPRAEFIFLGVCPRIVSIAFFI
jgi:hypothetical protein